MKKSFQISVRRIVVSIFVILSIAFLWMYFTNLRYIHKKHYLSTDIEVYTDDYFFVIIEIQVSVFLIAFFLGLKKTTTKNFFLKVFENSILGLLTFYLFQIAFMSILLPWNQSKVQDKVIRPYEIAKVFYNKEGQKTLQLLDLKSKDYILPCFSIKEIDTSNYKVGDTLMIHFKMGKFNLRFDPTNDTETLILYNPF